jgi:predicted dehydrogenase
MVRFAVIGQGHIGKRHAEMVRANSAAELVAVCDILPKESLRIERTERKIYSAVDEMLRKLLK